MAEQAIQFKGWQMGTWFAVHESELINQLKLMLETSDGTKVKVRLERQGLKLSKIKAIPMMTSEKKIPLSQIKNIFTDEKFPFCVFCSTCGPDGYLLKIIVIRCSKELHATGLVNFYRTLTFKKADHSAAAGKLKGNPNELKNEKLDENPAMKTKANGGTKIVNGVKEEGGNKVTTSTTEKQNGEVPENTKTILVENELYAKPDNIKKLSEEVSAIKQQTLKKHTATISQQEYVDAHEKVHRLEKELAKHKADIAELSSRVSHQHYDYDNLYSEVNKPNLKNPKSSFKSYQTTTNNNNKRHIYIANNEKAASSSTRRRAETVSYDMNPNPERRHFIRNSTKNIQVNKANHLGFKPITEAPTVSSTKVTNGSLPEKDQVVTVEPVYAQVNKNRKLKEKGDTNESERLPSKTSDNDAPPPQTSNEPPIPHRMVTFQQWNAQVQKRPSKRGQIEARRPHSFHYQHQYEAETLQQQQQQPRQQHQQQHQQPQQQQQQLKQHQQQQQQQQPQQQHQQPLQPEQLKQQQQHQQQQQQQLKQQQQQLKLQQQQQHHHHQQPRQQQHKQQPKQQQQPRPLTVRLNTHVSKPIEKVYISTSARNLVANEKYRPRVNSYTFLDFKQKKGNF